MKKCLIFILCLISIFFCTSCSNGYKRAIKNYTDPTYLDIKAFSYTNIHSLTCWDPKTYKIIITTLSANENYNWNVIWIGRVELDYRNFN